MRIKSSIRPLFIQILAALDHNENVVDDEMVVVLFVMIMFVACEDFL